MKGIISRIVGVLVLVCLVVGFMFITVPIVYEVVKSVVIEGDYGTYVITFLSSAGALTPFAIGYFTIMEVPVLISIGLIVGGENE